MAINLAVVKLKYTAIYIIALLLIYGCAAGPTTQEFKALDKRMARVERSLDDRDARVEELESKLLLIREKLKAGEGEPFSLDAREMTPPEGLRVIRLGDGKASVTVLSDKAAAPALQARRPLVVVKDKKPAEKALRPEVKDDSRQKHRGLASESPKALYKKGRSLYLAGNYTEARAMFSRITAIHPKSSLADNAFYWSGETFYREKKFSKALEQFSAVVEQYPDGNKVSDSLLKMGLSYTKLGDSDKAVALFKRLVDEYPDSEAAKTASKRLR